MGFSSGGLELLDLPEVSHLAKERRGGKASHPNVKLDPEVKRLAVLVAAHKELGLAELCNAILRQTLTQMWEAITDEIAHPKRKGGSQTA